MTDDVDRVLSAQEEHLEAELAELTASTGDIGSISFGKRVGEGTSMAVDRLAAVSTQEQLMAMLADVRSARQHVVDGTYGVCDVCGEPIPAGRLEARPWALQCVQHA